MSLRATTSCAYVAPGDAAHVAHAAHAAHAAVDAPALTAVPVSIEIVGNVKSCKKVSIYYSGCWGDAGHTVADRALTGKAPHGVTQEAITEAQGVNARNPDQVFVFISAGAGAEEFHKSLSGSEEEMYLHSRTEAFTQASKKVLSAFTGTDVSWTLFSYGAGAPKTLFDYIERGDTSGRTHVVTLIGSGRTFEQDLAYCGGVCPVKVVKSTGDRHCVYAGDYTHDELFHTPSFFVDAGRHPVTRLTVQHGTEGPFSMIPTINVLITQRERRKVIDDQSWGLLASHAFIGGAFAVKMM